MNIKTMALIAGICLLYGCEKSTQTSLDDTVKPVEMAIQGQVIYRERKLLPPGAELIVTLEDVSKMDVASKVIASSRENIENVPPYDFSLVFAESAIDQRMQYSLRAEIRISGALQFITTERFDPFRADKQPIELILSMVTNEAVQNDSLVKAESETERQVGAQTHVAIISVDPLSDLVNTYWKLISIGGTLISMEDSQEREAFLKLANEDSAITGFAGCNNYWGTFQLDGNTLNFGAIAMTRKACVSGMESETKLMHVLANTAHYSINQHQLTLYNKQAQAIATFDAIYF